VTRENPLSTHIARRRDKDPQRFQNPKVILGGHYLSCQSRFEQAAALAYVCTGPPYVPVRRP
jgi:hypothetical protein